jgi:hypothetical protein
MTLTRWFVSGLMILSLQSCGILETKPSDATMGSDSGKIDNCSKAGRETTRAPGALPSSGDCTLSETGFP